MTSTNDFLARLASAREVAKTLAIYRVPAGVMTMIAITAKAIETFPGVTIDEISDPAIIAEAFDAVAASRPESEDAPLDARVALFFSNASGERVLRVYKGNFASQGQIDDDPCAYDEPALHTWLATRYAGRRSP